MKLTFAIDLTQFDVEEYKKNPIVLYNFDYNQPPIGKATIADDKKSIEVELPPEGLNPVSDLVGKMFDYIDIGPAYSEEDKTLVGLSATPKYPENKLEGNIGAC